MGGCEPPSSKRGEVDTRNDSGNHPCVNVWTTFTRPLLPLQAGGEFSRRMENPQGRRNFKAAEIFRPRRLKQAELYS